MLTSSRTSAVAAALCATLRAREDGNRYAMRYYVTNQLHPIPQANAPRGVCETFALARGVVPVTTTVGALLANRRQHSSFTGSPQEFLRDIEDAPTLVFFYKPVCEPCKVIRDRLISSVSRPFEAVKSASATLPTREGASPHAAVPTASPNTMSDALPGSHLNNCDTTMPVRPDADAHNPGVPAALSAKDIMNTAVASSGGNSRSESFDADDCVSTPGLCEEDVVICHSIKKQLHEQLNEYADRIRILFVDTNASPRVTALHDIRSLPTFVAYVHGRPLGRVEGAQEEELMALLRRLVEAAEKGVVEPDGTL